MSTEVLIPGFDVPRSVYLSRNFGGDLSVVTIRPPVGLDSMRELAAAIGEVTGKGAWRVYHSASEARLSQYNQIDEDEALREVGGFVCAQLGERRYDAAIVNPDTVLRTSDGEYQEAA